jgi:ABC-2 type transport system ATP-binding protein
MIIFSAYNITKQFAGHLALDSVGIEVRESSIYGLLGPNGAGKTTFIRIMNQITAPDSGELFFMNRKLQQDDASLMGYLPEERGLYKKMKVGEQAIYLSRLKGLSEKEAKQKLKFWFEKLDIHNWWDKTVEELSKGMQQKVQFIVTVLHEPKLLIFDEPFSGFDPVNSKIMKQEILALREKGTTIIFSTHDMGSVEELCDDITLINKSKNILTGKVSDIKQQFKSDIYEIEFTGSAEDFKSLINGFYELINISSGSISHIARIKVKHSIADNHLLSLLIPKIHILSYKEILPNMNEIFIKVVSN